MRATYLDVVLDGTRELTREIRLFRLRAANGEPLPAFTAGAHILIEPIAGAQRAYSLCSDSAISEYYEVAVKIEKEGRGGSCAMHMLAPGMRLSISAPRNLFALVPETPPHTLLIGGGIGVTPLVAMAHQLARENAAFTLAQFSRGAEHLPFARTLRTWGSSVRLHFDDDAQQQLQPGALVAALPAGSHVYCCGPAGFVRWVREQARDLPSSQWHEEKFTTDGYAIEKAVRLTLARSGRTVTVPAGKPLLEALRESGLAPESSCEQGGCGSCVVPYRDGSVQHQDGCLTDEEREAYVALCCARVKSESLTLEL